MYRTSTKCSFPTDTMNTVAIKGTCYSTATQSIIIVNKCRNLRANQYTTTKDTQNQQTNRQQCVEI